MNLLACPASLFTLPSTVLRIAFATACLLFVTLGHAQADTACRTEPVYACPGLGSEGHAECHYTQGLPPCDEPVESGQFEGVLVEGRSAETLILTIRRDGGTPVQVWCPELCGKLSRQGADGNGKAVKKAYLGRRVRVTVTTEHNGGRVPGEDKEDKLLFVKKISFVK